jgi:hypothetical protein
MDATALEHETTPGETATRYASRPGALIWSFRKSRDRWKSKHQALKASVKGYKKRLADLTKSRERWKLKAEQAATRLAASEAEIVTLRAAGGENPPARPRSGL